MVTSNRINQMYEEMKSWRQDLHRIPEIGLEEYETSKYIKSKLSEFNIEFKDGYANTGIIAHIKGSKGNNDKSIGLRADFDALPMPEKNNFDHPDSVDFNLLQENLEDLINNREISVPIYDYKTHTREKNTSRKINNINVIILEGMFALYTKEIRDLMTIKIFVDTPSDIRVLRRIKRDVNKNERNELTINAYIVVI